MSRIDSNKITVEHLILLEEKPGTATLATILTAATGKNVRHASIAEYVALVSELQTAMKSIMDGQAGQDFAAILTARKAQE